jgi:hypothetical protein
MLLFTNVLKILNGTNNPTTDGVEFTFRDPYDQEPLASCPVLRVLGAYCVFLFVTGTIFNSALLYLIIKHKEYKNSLNIYIIALIALNLFGTVLELPFIFVSNLYCRWVFGKFGCIASAYLMYFVGCTSIYLIAAISVER